LLAKFYTIQLVQHIYSVSTSFFKPTVSVIVVIRIQHLNFPFLDNHYNMHLCVLLRRVVNINSLINTTVVSQMTYTKIHNIIRSIFIAVPYLSGVFIVHLQCLRNPVSSKRIWDHNMVDYGFQISIVGSTIL